MILVTGSTGFVGSAVSAGLVSRGYLVRGTSRSARRIDAEKLRYSQLVVVPHVDGTTDWSEALRGAEVVVHCAAQTEVKSDRRLNLLSLYRRVNVDGTRHLAEQAARCGVKRFVYLSSVKAAGERSAPDQPLRVSDAPVPEDAYGISKREAELALLEVGAATGLETVIIRPPIVYGPGVKGNFLRLLRAIDMGYPLPLAGLDNRRSAVFLSNLVDFICLCVEAPAAVGGTFFVSDGEDLSTADLARRIGAAFSRSVRVFPVPVGALLLLARIAGKTSDMERLLGTLQVDLTDVRRFLSWSPPHTVEHGLRETAMWFRRRP